MQTHSRENRVARCLIALFFITLLALGIFTSADYGQPWDEPWEQDILRMNGNQYAYYLGFNGHMTLTSDMLAPKNGMISSSVERDHGECAYYPLLWLVADTSMPAMQRMVIWHAYTWILFMAGVGALWFICRMLGLSRMISCIAALFLVLTPRMFAEGHYNNKDVVLMVLVLLTLWLSLRLMERPSANRSLWFSLAGAAAANTKIIGLFVWGLCALMVFIRLLASKQMNRRAWFAAGTALLSFMGFYMLLTPAMWNDPLGYIKYVIDSAANFTRWQNDVLFRGSILNLKNTELPRYYLPYMVLVTTPLWVLFFLAVGQGTAVARFVRRKPKLFQDNTTTALLLCTMLWLVPLLYAVLGQPTMYNGWRHFYFIYGPMLVLAAFGLDRIAKALLAWRKPAIRTIAVGLLALCMGITGTQMTLSHAKQYSYYNELILGKLLPTYLELDYWNVSTLETLHALIATLPPDLSEPMSICGSEFWSHNGLKSAIALLTDAEQACFRLIPKDSRSSVYTRAWFVLFPRGSDSAVYTVTNSTYEVLGHWRPASNQTPVVETRSFGVPICTIYQQNVH